MDKWMLWTAIFSSGVAVGALITTSLPRLWHPKKRRTQLAEARLFLGCPMHLKKRVRSWEAVE